MSGIETHHDEVAKRYGRVLFELAQENKDSKTVTKDASLLKDSLKEFPLEWSQLLNPSISLQAQTLTMEKLAIVLKLGDLMSRFLGVLCINRRLQKLNVILDDFFVRSHTANNKIEGILETPIELDQKEIEMLQTSLKKQLGKNVSLQQTIKESLLGGVVLRIGSLMIDASIRTQLNKLRYAMKG